MKTFGCVLVACLVLMGSALEVSAQRGERKGPAVSIKNGQYTPARLTVQRGETVTWTNNDDRDHTVDGADDEFASGTIKPGKSFRHTFRKAGTYAYRCRLHPRMKGTIVVK